MDIVKLGWSGGKDSTCAFLKHIERGDKVKAVCYIPMLTKEIPLILKKHHEFILKTADYFRSLGADVYITSGITYYEYVTHIAKSGKFKGQMFGFPCINPGQCGFNRDSKSKAVRQVDVGHYDYESVAIADDEVKRHGQLNESKRSILCELKITEARAAEIDDANNLLSPLYTVYGLKRDGCALCFNASEKERRIWFNDYPEAVPVVLELQRIVKEHRPERAPLRGSQWFIQEGNMEEIFKIQTPGQVSLLDELEEEAYAK